MKSPSLIRRETDSPRKRLFCYSSDKHVLFLRYISNEPDENLAHDPIYMDHKSDFYRTHIKKQTKLTFFLIRINFFDINPFFASDTPEEEKTLDSDWCSNSHDLRLEDMDKLFK